MDLNLDTPMYGGKLLVYLIISIVIFINIIKETLMKNSVLNKTGFAFSVKIRVGLKDFAVGPIYIDDVKVLDKMVINASIP